MNNSLRFGKNSTEVINVRDKVNQMFKDKLFLVMLVLGLLTIVAAAGIITVQRGKGGATDPYLDMPQPELIAQETASDTQQIAGASDAVRDGGEDAGQEVREEEMQILTDGSIGGEYANRNQGNDLAAEAGAGGQAADALVLNFTDTSRMSWPVRGNVILDYSMDRTTYFPTLDQYKCNPGLVIQSEVSTPVAAPANARVLEVGSNEEIGNFVVLDLGNDYTAVCGQMKEICAVQGEYLKEGQTLGYVSEPTKYYSVEGVNVFFELKHGEKPVDPLDYLE